MRRVVVSACVLAVILSGCTKKPVAIVNGKRVSAQEFDAQLRKEAGGAVLAQMIQDQLLRDGFAAAGLTLDPATVEERLQASFEANGGQEVVLAQLAASGLTEADLRDDVEKGLMLQMLCEKDLTYTEEDLKAYYEETKLRWDMPERVVFSAIVLGTEEEANEVYALCREPEANFRELAIKYSLPDDPWKQEGGRRPAWSEFEIIPVEARDFAFKMQPGQLHEPFEGGGVWHIIKLEEKLPKELRTFEDVREGLEEHYKQEHKVSEEEILQQLRTASDVRIEDPEFQDLQRYFIGQALLDAAPGGDGALVSPEPAPETDPDAVETGEAPPLKTDESPPPPEAPGGEATEAGE